MHGHPGRGGQDPAEASPNTCIHHSAQRHLHRVSDAVDPASVHPEHPNGPAEAPRDVHPCLPGAEHLPPLVHLLLHFRSSLTAHHRPPSGGLAAPEDRLGPGHIDPLCSCRWSLREVQEGVRHQTWVPVHLLDRYAGPDHLLVADPLLPHWNSRGFRHSRASGVPLPGSSRRHEEHRVVLRCCGRWTGLLLRHSLEQNREVAHRERRRRAAFVALPEHKYWEIRLLLLAAVVPELSQFLWLHPLLSEIQVQEDPVSSCNGALRHEQDYGTRLGGRPSPLAVDYRLHLAFCNLSTSSMTRDSLDYKKMPSL